MFEHVLEPAMSILRPIVSICVNIFIILVLILGGNLEIGANIRSEISNLICLTLVMMEGALCAPPQNGFIFFTQNLSPTPNP